MLALAAAAGGKEYTAIAGCVKDLPPPVLADLYLRARRQTGTAAVEGDDLADDHHAQ